MKHLTLTSLLIGSVPLSLFAATIPASANDSQVIPVEAVAPLESPTGTVRDLGTISGTSAAEWYWGKQNGGSQTTTETNLKLPEVLTPSAEEPANPAKVKRNDGNWSNTGERRRSGVNIDLTEF